jgi:hypothetical protein
MASKSTRGTRPVAVSGVQSMKPGDEAPPGTPGTGENVCPVCSGRGQVDGRACTNCSGTGKINTGIGGA